MILRLLRLSFSLKYCLGLLALVLTLASIIDAGHIHGILSDQPDDCVVCHQTDHLSGALSAKSFHWPATTVSFTYLGLPPQTILSARPAKASIRAPPEFSPS